jgi:hypothetical protein
MLTGDRLCLPGAVARQQFRAEEIFARRRRPAVYTALA